MEVSGNNTHSTLHSMTGGVRSKMRPHGVQKAQQYTPVAHLASGVPLRLSAREVEDDEDDANGADEDHLAVRNSNAHTRSGSGRSSVASSSGGNGQRLSSMYGVGRPSTGTNRSSDSGTPPQTRASVASTYDASQSAGRARADTQSTVRSEGGAEPTPVPDRFRGEDYFSGSSGAASKAAAAAEEEEASFGGVGGLPKRVGGKPMVDEKTAEELQRRGSVDERTTTMRGYGRLFVANPDLSD